MLRSLKGVFLVASWTFVVIGMAAVGAIAQNITQIIDSTGDGTNSLDNPGRIAVDGLGNVYVTGLDNVFEITPGGSITQIIDSTGDGTNGLYWAADVAVDGLGNVYVAGRARNNVFEITGLTSTETCADGLDNDGDGLVDGNDPAVPPRAVRRSGLATMW